MVLIDIYVVLIKYFLSCLKSSNRAEKREYFLVSIPPMFLVGQKLLVYRLNFNSSVFYVLFILCKNVITVYHHLTDCPKLTLLHSVSYKFLNLSSFIERLLTGYICVTNSKDSTNDLSGSSVSWWSGPRFLDLFPVGSFQQNKLQQSLKCIILKGL